MSECQCRILNGLQFSSGCDLHGEPRSWQLPPEPGPEVKAVRDYQGDLWARRPDGWGWALSAENNLWGWQALLMDYGPLTDVTHELEGEE